MVQLATEAQKEVRAVGLATPAHQKKSTKTCQRRARAGERGADARRALRRSNSSEGFTIWFANLSESDKTLIVSAPAQMKPTKMPDPPPKNTNLPKSDMLWLLPF